MSTETHVYSVPGMTCGHCVQAITDGVTPLDGVSSLVVDLDTKRVTVVGGDDEAIRSAIDEAGFDIAP